MNTQNLGFIQRKPHVLLKQAEIDNAHILTENIPQIRRIFLASDFPFHFSRRDAQARGLAVYSQRGVELLDFLKEFLQWNLA